MEDNQMDEYAWNCGRIMGNNFGIEGNYGQQFRIMGQKNGIRSELWASHGRQCWHYKHILGSGFVPSTSL